MSLLSPPNITQDIVPWVNLLEARAEDGHKVAVLFEHLAHPVRTLEAPERLTADFPGYAIARIHQEVDGEVVLIFAQGCSGNINGVHVADGHKHASTAGIKLGAAVLKALGSTTEIQADKFSLRSKTIMLPLHLFIMEKWVKMIEWIKVPPREDWSNNGSTMKTMEVLKGMMERDEPPQIPIEINTVMLGSQWCMVTMAGEVFTVLPWRSSRRSV